jgi:hypothetical protein
LKWRLQNTKYEIPLNKRESWNLADWKISVPYNDIIF